MPQQQIDENRRNAPRSEILRSDECIIRNHGDQRLSDKSQRLNLAYRTLDFRMDKIRSLISDFNDVVAEMDRFIEAKLEEIASGAGR